LDFEIAAITAFTEAFPTSQIRGCWFHLSQSIYRQVQQLGFQQRYQSDKSFATYIRMFSALAFVPKRDVMKRFSQVVQILPTELKPLASYFE